MANSQAKTIDIKTLETLYGDIEVMGKALESLRKRVIDLLPAEYGSDLWWEKSDRRAMKKIAAGKGRKFNSAEEVVRYLES